LFLDFLHDGIGLCFLFLSYLAPLSTAKQMGGWTSFSLHPKDSSVLYI